LTNGPALPNFIDNEWVSSQADEYITFYNPAFATELGKVPVSTPEEVRKAVEAASRGFHIIRKKPATERVAILLRLRSLVEQKTDELASILVDNHGRTFAEGVAEVKRSMENIESAAAIAYTLAKGEIMPNVSEGIDQELLREPLGVFAIVTPFNIPLHAWSSYVPYAIALGCSVVLKPSEITPLISSKVLELMKLAGVPPGVANLVHGGPSVVNELVRHPEVVGVGFIGSTNTAKQLYRLAAETGKRASINAGAKNHIVVMPDADAGKTVPALVSSFFGMTGQRCLAGSNLVLVGQQTDEIQSRFVKSSALRIGYGGDPDVEMGPLASSAAYRRVLAYVDGGVEDGARMLLDGRQNKPTKPLNGYFIGPTIFDDTENTKLSKEEIFGPVASILHVNSLDEAVELINRKSPYGNAASIFTSNPKTAREFAHSVNIGNVGINVGVPQPMAYFPIGGRKESFFGGAHSRVDTLRFFTDHKIVVSRWW